MGHVERVTLFPSPACPIQGREKGAMIMPHPLFETISPRPLVQRQLLNGNSSTASGGCSPTRAHRSHPTRSRRHFTVPVSRFWRRFASILKPSTIPQATLPACPSHFIRRATSCSWESGPSLAGAPDVLVFPVVLGCPAHIVSTCPVTGTGIQLTVKEDHIEDLSPASATVSIVKDGGACWGNSKRRTASGKGAVITSFSSLPSRW